MIYLLNLRADHCFAVNDCCCTKRPDHRLHFQTLLHDLLLQIRGIVYAAESIIIFLINPKNDSSAAGLV